MTIWLALLIKTSILLGAALVAAFCARRASASLRHAILAAGVVGALMLPASLAIVPEWELPADVARPLPLTTRAPAETPSAPSVLAVRSTMPAATFPWVEIAGAVWVAGSAMTLAFIAIGLWRLRTLDAGAAPAGAEWERLVRSLASRLRVDRPVVVSIGRGVQVPVTWGLRHPRILLPQEAHAWSEQRRRIVLAHELAHIARGDWPIHLAGEVMCAAYWFNPLAWATSRQRKDEAERACDDRVLTLGITGVDYAAELVDLARSAQRQSWLPAPAVVRTPHLERRIRAMLNPRVNRSSLSRSGRAAVAGIAFAASVLLGAVTAAQTLASFGGSIVDPHNAVLPDVRLTLTKADDGAKIEVRSDRQGRFEFPPLEPGDYAMVVTYPGFSSLRSTVHLEGGQRMEPSFQMPIGELEETVYIVDDGKSGPAADAGIQEVKPRPIPQCRPVERDGMRVGGNLRPPIRTRNVSPVYPPHLSGSGQSAIVALEGVIGLDGKIEELRSVNNPPPDFEVAALDAVREWAWDQTLLNCEPVRVKVHVRMRFESR